MGRWTRLWPTQQQPLLPQPAHLHCKAAHAAGAAMHQDALALQRHARLQRLQRGEARDGQGTRLLEAHALWDGAAEGLIHRHILGIGACRRQRS